VRRSPADIWRAENFRRLRFTGVEASLAARLAREHQLHLRYTGLRGVQALGPGLLTKYTFNYPIHSGVATWTGPIAPGWVGRTRVGVLERYARSPYAVWDVSVTAVKGRVRPFAQLGNLTGTAYEEIFGVPMPGRSVLAGVQLVLQ
jgi:iron complex outermembrane receptor protein